MHECNNILHSCIGGFLHWCTVHFDAVVERLRDRLTGPLPGAAAHALLAPQPRRQWPEGFNAAGIRDAAGLLLVFPIDDRPHIVLTVRAGTLGRHGGQVSLPGGVVEPGETFEQAALREAHEEIGLPVADAYPIGRLTPLDIPISRFRLHPVVATIARRPALTAADGEVARILEIPLETLCDRKFLASSERERDGHRLLVPAFHVGGHEIWGATAMVLAEFLALLGWHPQDVRRKDR
jgi:8-oxo-dGTP pyrophosphatase MutT (NUDIX family)